MGGKLSDDSLRWHIVSYPRSGNHAARAIIEATTGRPTLGCRGSTPDTPIYLRSPNKRDGLIRIRDKTPIGYKAHWNYEIIANEREIDGQMGFLLMLRDPVDAIASQSYRLLARKKYYLPQKQIAEVVNCQVKDYIALLTYFAAFRGLKACIRFECLLSSDPGQRMESVKSITRLVGGYPENMSIDKIDLILKLAKESQESLGAYKQRRMDDIRSNIRDLITMSDVERILGSALRTSQSFMHRLPDIV